MTFDELFEDFSKKIDRDFLTGKEKDTYQKQVAAVRTRYAAIKDLKTESNIAVGLLERGHKVLKAGPLKADVVKGFIRYCKAAWYDLSGNLSAYKWYVRCFFASTITFFILAPQFFGAILPLIFIIPVFFGLKGLKSRTMIGFTMSAMIFPMSLMSGTTAARAYFGALFWNMAEFASTQASSFGISVEFSKTLVYVFAPVSLVAVVASVAGAVIGIMHREMFI